MSGEPQRTATAAARDELNLLGVDHHRTPVALRERLAVGRADIEEYLRFIHEDLRVPGAVILSTCNRTEYYLAGVRDPVEVCRRIWARQGVAAEEVAGGLCRHEDTDAVRHLFRVAASLESMVVGEYQILHQVKFAYEQSRLHGCTTRAINRCFQTALAVGKEVRNETGIGKHKLSTASIAVDLADAIHGDLGHARLLLSGAGEMADLAMQHFLTRGLRHVTIVNRNRQRAEDLAARLLHQEHLEVEIRHWNELPQALGSHDIILTSTAAPVPVIRCDDVRQAMHKRRQPLMLIDLAVPRDVAPEISELEDVYLYNIDHLEAVAARHRELREDEVEAAAELVETRLRECLAARATGLGQLRRQVAHHFDDLVAAESGRLQQRLRLDDETTADELRHGMGRLAKKMQHHCLAWLQRNDGRDDAEAIIRDLLEITDVNQTAGESDGSS